ALGPLDPERSLREVELEQAQPGGFAPAEAEPVEQLDQGPVAERERSSEGRTASRRLRARGLAQERFDLGLAQEEPERRVLADREPAGRVCADPALAEEQRPEQAQGRELARDGGRADLLQAL